MVPRGTTAVVCDPHEIANVAGVEGVDWLLDATEGLPLDVFVMAPSCVPAIALRVAVRAARRPTTMRAILRHPRALGVAEMMNFPGVIAGDPRRARADGRAARRRARARACAGRALNAYVAAGIRTDHEAFTAEEALEKRRARHVGADPRGVQRAQPARAAAHGARARARTTARSAPTTASPTSCTARGTSTRCAAIAVARGVAAEDVLVMASLHGARRTGCSIAGRSRPATSRTSSCSTTSSTSRVRWCSRTAREAGYRRGVPGRRCATRCAPSPVVLRRRHGADWVRVIEISPGQLITGAVGGAAVATATSSPTRRATWPRSP